MCESRNSQIRLFRCYGIGAFGSVADSLFRQDGSESQSLFLFVIIFPVILHSSPKHVRQVGFHHRRQQIIIHQDQFRLLAENIGMGMSRWGGLVFWRADSFLGRGLGLIDAEGIGLGCGEGSGGVSDLCS